MKIANMHGTLRLGLFLLITLSVMVFSFPANQSMAMSPIQASDEDQIRKVIDAYFTLRYESRKQLVEQDYSALIALDNPDTQKWLEKVKGQDEIKLYEAKLFELNYLEYKFDLDFKSIQFEQDNVAIAKLLEGHQVVFEAIAPIVSEMANLDHTITLEKGEKGWLIVKDIYIEDSLPDLDNSTAKGEAIEYVRKNFEEAQSLKQAKEKGLLESSPQATEMGLLGPASISSFHGYNRGNAASYAYTYALSYNVPEYYDFTGNDCTNFISQAMHDASEGANIPYDQAGSLKWFYTSPQTPGTTYSYSFTGVQDFWYYMTNPEATGPYGTEVSLCSQDIAYGDIVQVKSGGSSTYNHAGMITNMVGYPERCYNYSSILIAAHDTDRRSYPLSNWSSLPWRFLHIQGWND